MIFVNRSGKKIPAKFGRGLFTCRALLSLLDDQLPRPGDYLAFMPGIKPQRLHQVAFKDNEG